MIPKIIHYCWFGGNPMPELAEQCIASWKRYMPEWEYKEWTEATLSQALNQPNPNPSLKGRETNWLDYMPTYVKQAYEARKFAFVSDYVRLWALEQYGGLYMDVDFMVYRPFDELMDRYPAFAGYEGSKRQPVMQGVLASEPHGVWVRDMLQTYQFREFIRVDGSLDLTPNTAYFTDRLESQGFIADGKEKDFYIERKTKTENNTACAEINQEDTIYLTKNAESPVADSNIQSTAPYSAREQAPGQTNDQLHATDADAHHPLDSLQKNVICDDSQKNVSLHSTSKNNHAVGKVLMLHVFPIHYFCPVLTTGEDVRTAETYCEHMGESSWATNNSWKAKLLRHFSPEMRTKLIKLKRRILG